MSDIERAKSILIKNNYTCVLCKGDKEYHSSLRGVRPLLDFLESEYSYTGFSAADKTIGAGAAHLYVLLGVSCVWAAVISQKGLDLLEKNGIEVHFDTKVPFIINRAGNGPCPIENATRDIEDPHEALCEIRRTLSRLAAGN